MDYSMGLQRVGHDLVTPTFTFRMNTTYHNSQPWAEERA